jgi:hypothetical protein
MNTEMCKYLSSPSVSTASAETHTMGASLYDYVCTKVHADIRKGTWSRIIVRGLHERTPPTRATDSEKIDKPFNWQRPTATLIEMKTLYLNCFPGVDYVEHYAGIVATYLSLIGRDPTIVRCSLPTESECIAPLIHSNLEKMGHVDVVVLGYVHHLEKSINGTWQGGGSGKNDLFAWQKFHTPHGRSVSYLGCMISFWGDISGHLIRALQRLNHVKCVLYVGKAGSLHAEHQPNEWIATGNHSLIGDRIVRWDNVLSRDLRLSTKVLEGSHVTVASPLCEDRAWLEKYQPICIWVDCEVGHMAQVSNEGCTSFAYLHIVSDNIARQYPHNLSNERLKAVIASRKKLFNHIELILDSFLAHWDYSEVTTLTDGLQ